MVVLQICFGGRHEGSQQPTRHKRHGDISFSFRLPSQSDDLDVSSLERAPAFIGCDFISLMCREC